MDVSGITILNICLPSSRSHLVSLRTNSKSIILIVCLIVTIPVQLYNQVNVTAPNLYIYAMFKNSLSTEMMQGAKGSSINTKQYLVYWSVLEALHRTLLTIGTTGSLDLTKDTIRTCQKVFVVLCAHNRQPSFIYPQ